MTENPDFWKPPTQEESDAFELGRRAYWLDPQARNPYPEGTVQYRKWAIGFALRVGTKEPFETHTEGNFSIRGGQQ